MAMSPSQILALVEDAVGGTKTENAAVNAVQKTLGRYGFAKGPSETRQGRSADGATVRVYVWLGTPAGDVALISGPSIVSEVKPLAEIEASGTGAAPGVYLGTQAPKGGEAAYRARYGAVGEREAARAASYQPPPRMRPPAPEPRPRRQRAAPAPVVLPPEPVAPSRSAPDMNAANAQLGSLAAMIAAQVKAGLQGE